MRKKVEGIEVTRSRAVEQKDGSLVVQLVIPSGGKAAFFGLFADPGAPLLLCAIGAEIDGQAPVPAADKPLTQRIAPIGVDVSKGMGSDMTPQIVALLSHPPFQSWVEMQCPISEGGDAVMHAKAWLMREAKIGPEGFGSREARANVIAVCQRYGEWFLQTRGSGENPLPWQMTG